jgi:hypothetical protein
LIDVLIHQLIEMKVYLGRPFLCLNFVIKAWVLAKKHIGMIGFFNAAAS